MKRVLLGLGILFSAQASAQNRPDPGRELELIESTERSEDPLGLDESTGSGLEHAAAKLKPQTAPVILPSAELGAALSAIAGIRESAHTAEVELAHGLAFVEATLALSSRAKHAAEVAYRFALPAGAAVTRVRLCVGERCRDAAPSAARTSYLQALAKKSASAGEPMLWAEPIHDAQGAALALRIAPIAPQIEARIAIDYVAEAPVRGGRVRFRLPARGYDPRLVPAQIRVRTRELSELQPASAFELDAFASVELSGVLRAASSTSVRAACGTSVCTRSYRALPLGAATLRPTWLFVDASPSMEGPARGRASSVLAALLSALPEETELHALAFAARVHDLGHFRAADAPLGELADATLRELGAATQLSAALAASAREHARERPRIVVISDGLFDATAREQSALVQARKQGAELWLLAVGERTPRLAGLFQHVLALSALADATVHRDDLEPLVDALRTIASPRTLGLGAGEQRVHEDRPQRAYALAASGPWLSFWLAPRTSFFTGASEVGPLLITAPPYSTAEPAPPPLADTGMPAESVLSMLRTQLVPQARACLRSDRKGRGDYAVELTFHALFAEREVYDARVEGTIAGPLRRCLEALLPTLRVPAFSGRIRVKYPIHTEREPAPPVIALEPEVQDKLERAFEAAPALP